MTVNPEIPNETVDITYDKIPEPQEGQEIISYQDANGQVIHTQTVTGEEGSDVSFKPEVPTNWQTNWRPSSFSKDYWRDNCDRD